jgi:hypothetical protein
MRETIISTELTQGKKVGGKEPLSKVAVRLGLTRVLLKRYAIELVNSNPGLAEWYACAGRNHETGNVAVSAS